MVSFIASQAAVHLGVPRREQPLEDARSQSGERGAAGDDHEQDAEARVMSRRTLERASDGTERAARGPLSTNAVRV